MDEFGFSTIIGTYNSDFETSMNCWKQVDYDSCDWVKYNGKSFHWPTTGPNGTPNGSTNYLLMYYGNYYPGYHSYIESPPIDLDDYCQIELTFAYHKNHELWGNQDPSSLAVDISFDNGQNWQNNFWFIEGDQDTVWHYETIYLPSSVTKIRFHGYFYHEYQFHDMALDDITIGPVIETNPITIEGDVEWEGEHVICSNIEIEPNSSLTLLPGCEVKMFTDRKIVVKRSAKLVVDNAVITDNNNQLWQGIELWGQYNQPQSYFYQGSVEIINGSMIENAKVAVNTIKFGIPDGESSDPQPEYSGGMVLCDGAIFKNNNIAVKFWPYTFALSNSLFRNCQFITDNDLLTDADPNYFIKMNNITSIDIAGCLFTDGHTYINPDELTSGIESFNANYSLFSYGSQANVFTGLYDGIRAYTHNPERTVSIDGCEFHENIRSLYLSSQIGTVVTNNTFSAYFDPFQGDEEMYCMYLDYCTDYTVEENDFSYSGQGAPQGIGMVINNSGPNENEIYNNNFTNLEYATLAQNCNRGFFDWKGLQIKCNDYWGNYQDIAVTAWEEVEYPGIARNQ